MEITVLYDLQHTMAAEYLSKFKYPWEALNNIKKTGTAVFLRCLLLQSLTFRRGKRCFGL